MARCSIACCSCLSPRRRRLIRLGRVDGASAARRCPVPSRVLEHARRVAVKKKKPSAGCERYRTVLELRQAPQPAQSGYFTEFTHDGVQSGTALSVIPHACIDGRSHHEKCPIGKLHVYRTIAGRPRSRPRTIDRRRKGLCSSLPQALSAAIRERQLVIFPSWGAGSSSGDQQHLGRRRWWGATRASSATSRPWWVFPTFQYGWTEDSWTFNVHPLLYKEVAQEVYLRGDALLLQLPQPRSKAHRLPAASPLWWDFKNFAKREAGARVLPAVLGVPEPAQDHGPPDRLPLLLGLPPRPRSQRETLAVFPFYTRWVRSDYDRTVVLNSYYEKKREPARRALAVPLLPVLLARRHQRRPLVERAVRPRRLRPARGAQARQGVLDPVQAQLKAPETSSSVVLAGRKLDVREEVAVRSLLRVQPGRDVGAHLEQQRDASARLRLLAALATCGQRRADGRW